MPTSRTRKPPARTRMPRAEREAQMLQVAERVFGARGFQAATMDEIAEQVGVTKPLIYDYFGSKEGLFAATIERARHQLLAAVIWGIVFLRTSSRQIHFGEIEAPEDPESVMHHRPLFERLLEEVGA